MKKNYQTPTTLVITLATAILCASGGTSNVSSEGNLESIGKGTGSWS